MIRTDSWVAKICISLSRQQFHESFYCVYFSVVFLLGFFHPNPKPSPGPCSRIKGGQSLTHYEKTYETTQKPVRIESVCPKPDSAMPDFFQSNQMGKFGARTVYFVKSGFDHTGYFLLVATGVREPD